MQTCCRLLNFRCVKAIFVGLQAKLGNVYLLYPWAALLALGPRTCIVHGNFISLRPDLDNVEPCRPLWVGIPSGVMQLAGVWMWLNSAIISLLLRLDTVPPSQCAMCAKH